MSVLSSSERAVALTLGLPGLYLLYQTVSQGHYVLPILAFVVAGLWYAYARWTHGRKEHR